MPRPLKYNFIAPGSNTIPESTDSVSMTKQGSILFLKAYASKYKILGKFIRFYVDPVQHEVGWVFRDSLEGFSELKCSQFRILKKSKAGVVSLSIRSILNQLGFAAEKSTPCEVNIYKDPYLNDVHHINVPHKKEILCPKDIETAMEINQ